MRRPANPLSDQPTSYILYWWHEQGYHYVDRINILQSEFDEVQAEAGPNGHLCAITQKHLDEIDERIWEIATDACDRYDDLASDPMP